MHIISKAQVTDLVAIEMDSIVLDKHHGLNVLSLASEEELVAHIATPSILLPDYYKDKEVYILSHKKAVELIKALADEFKIALENW